VKYVSVVDYGMGNLLSVQRALEQCGAQVRFVSRPGQIVEAERLVLPGVGAFQDGMKELRERRLDDELRAFVAAGRPLLGICLGMQMLFDESHERGVHAGLGLVAGRVVAVPERAADGRAHKIPHIGWAELRPSRAWAGTILDGLEPNAHAYFVHSYVTEPRRPELRLAEVDYGKMPLVAAIADGAVAGCQFHPEKSGPVGLRVIANFLAL